MKKWPPFICNLPGRSEKIPESRPPSNVEQDALKAAGLRYLLSAEIKTLAHWEQSERPYRWTEAHFLETLASSTQKTVVYEQQGVLLGFAVVQRVDQEAYLLNIMVSADHRRKGVGSTLLQKVMIWIRSLGVRHFFLDVEAGNAAALKLYEKSGFEPVGHRPHAYPGGEDAILMRKDL